MRRLFLGFLVLAVVVPAASANDRTLRRCHRHHTRHYCRKHGFHHTRVHWLHATASWYNDSGATASGWHARYGFADCGSSGPCWPFGATVRFCYHGCVTAVADDHGPYVYGREFDLGASTAGAIGFGGVNTVRYRVLHY